MGMFGHLKFIRGRIQTVQESKGQAGRQLAKDLSRMINNMASEEDEQAFVEEVMRDHRTLQQKTARLFLQCFIGWAADYERGYFDGRNETTCKIAHDFIKLLEAEYIVIRDRAVLPYI